MDAHYDRFFIGDNVYDAVAGREAFRDNLVGYFPREAAAIDRYLELLSEVSRGMRTFTLDRTLPPWAAAVAGPFLRRRLPKSFERTTWEVLSELTDDPELIAVLTGQWGDMGLPPKRSSFVIQALIARHYLHGGFYPVGGAWRIAETILPRIRASGGEVFTYARVKEILRARRSRPRRAHGRRPRDRVALRDLGCGRDQHLRTAAAGRKCRAAHGYDAAAAEGEAEHRPPRRVHRPARPRPPNSACRRPTSGSTRTTTTTARSTEFEADPSGRSRSCTSRSRRRRTRTSSGAIRASHHRDRGARAVRDLRSRGPARPGASAATTTRRSSSAYGETPARARVRQGAAGARPGGLLGGVDAAVDAVVLRLGARRAVRPRPRPVAPAARAGCGRARGSRACGSPARTSCPAASPAR